MSKNKQKLNTLESWLGITPKQNINSDKATKKLIKKNQTHKKDVKEQKEISRKFFYLNWKQKTCNWLKESEINNIEINFEKEVNWRSVSKIKLLGFFPNETELTLNSKQRFYPKGFLKSHLQKCIRRKLSEKSIKTSWHLFKLHKNDLLRRLPIIMIEDTTVFQEFNILTWLMIAINDIKWTKSLANFVLETVKNISETNDCIYYHKSEIKDVSNFLDSVENSLQSQDLKNICYSLQLRKAYGGMKGDMRMIDYYSNLILNKKIKEVNQLNSYPSEINIQKISNLKTSEIEVSGIDFHCYPQILDTIQNKYSEINNNNIKNAIWFHRSGLNLRKNSGLPVCNSYQDTWEKIKKYTEQVSLDIISEKLYLKYSYY